MLGLTNKDSAFFLIESPDVPTDYQNLSNQIEQFSYTEEMGKLGMGSVVMDDPGLVYSKIFRIGAQLLISFGYKNKDFSLQSQLAKSFNPTELLGQIERRNIKAFITNPSGSGDAKGKKTYKMNFCEYGMRGGIVNNVYESGTKADIVADCFNKLGVSQIYRDIRFDRGIDAVTSWTAVRQEESTFKFLSTFAIENQAIFRLAYTRDNQIAGLFISPKFLGTQTFQNQLLQATGNSNYFDYKGKVCNVISYDWENREGESGTGDNVQISFVNGQPVFRQYLADTQQVVTWKLRPDRIDQFLKDQPNFQAKVEATKNYLSAQSFDQIKYFFDATTTTTAPQGYGYTVNLHVLGNPLITCPSTAEFGEGFPAPIGSSKQKWYIRKVSHSISMSGYFSDADVIDAFALSETGNPVF